MPYCRQCGCRLDVEDAFCRHCGTRTGFQPDASVNYTSNSMQGQTQGISTVPSDAQKTQKTPSIAAELRTTANPQHDRTYMQTIERCPRCGEILDWDDGICPSCGWELRGRAPDRTSSAFSERLYDFQNRYAEAVIQSNSSDPKVAEIAKRTKLDLIRIFVIPNTAEDLTEVAVLASSNVADDDVDLSDAWMSKLTQTRDKAAMLFPGSIQSERIESLYDKSVDERKRRSRSASWKRRSARLESLVRREDFLYITMAVVFFGGIMLSGLFYGMIDDIGLGIWGLGILLALGLFVLFIAIYVMVA